jgi:hypothetical protein
MKTLMKGVFFLLLLSTISACRSKEFDPATGIVVQLDVQAELFASNASKLGETFEKSYTYDLRAEFKNRYNIDLDTVEAESFIFKITELDATFDQDRCKDIDYTITTDVPIIGTKAFSNLCDGTLIGGKPAALRLNATTAAVLPYGKLLLDTNFGPAILKGGKLIVTFKMKPKVDFATGLGGSVYLYSTATFKPK